MKMRLKISLRLKFILYLILIHLLFAGVAVYLISKNRVWLLAVEAVFIVSLYAGLRLIDRKSTRLNSSHLGISYAVFCLKKKTKIQNKQKRVSKIANTYMLCNLLVLPHTASFRT